MNIPILSGIRELDSGPRRFMLFMAINVICWQCLVGEVLVLFARALEMPERQVGILLSLMPLTMLMVLFTVPLVERLGSRRLLLLTWTTRNLMATGVFLIPWATAKWGAPGGWYMLMASVFGFCVIRALGVGAWYPWLHEVVPKEKRGAYFSTEMGVMQISTLLVLLMVSWILKVWDVGMARYYVIFGIGIIAGMSSLFTIRRIPGGRQIPNAYRGSGRMFGSIRLVIADKDFMRYVVLAGCCNVALIFLAAARTMYLRDILGYPDWNIMAITCVAALAVALMIRPWGNYADRNGSGPAMMLLLGGHSVVAFGWLFLVPGASWTPWLAPVLFILVFVASAAFWSIANRGMLCRVKDKGKVAYGNIWTVGLAVAMGLTPIIAGYLIETWEIEGFRICFAASFVLGLISVLALASLPQEEGKPPIPHLTELLRPSQPVRSLGRIVWITLGMDDRENGREGK